LFCRPLGTGNATNSHDKNPRKRRAGRSFIIHLNTRTPRQFRTGQQNQPWVRQPIAATPGRPSRTHRCIRKNQHARPDAPKPIHPDKEHFCSKTSKVREQTSSFLHRIPFAE
jgi:hypothetical protein